jgi:anti-anti-sigma regulatory factor
MIIHENGDVIALKGSLDTNQWPALRSVVSLRLKEHPSGVILDGSSLTDITEAGAHTFLDASNFIQAHHARVVVSGLPDNILEAIRRIPGVRSQLPLASSVEEARASLAVGGEEAVHTRSPAFSLMMTERQFVATAGLTQASSVIPVVRSRLAASFIVTQLLLPFNDNAAPYFPVPFQLALFSVPVLPFPERSFTVVPLPSLNE